MLFDIHEPGQTPLPHAEDVVAVGIDLGTTHSVVAITREQKTEVLRDEGGNGLIPSVVAYTPAGVEVGLIAKQRLQRGEPHVIASIKRLMGRSAADVRSETGNVPYTVAETGEGMVRLKLGTAEVTPVEVSAEILRAVKARAEQSLGKPVTQAVITVPAYFDDAARTATKDAARLAGLEVLRLLAEPTAAALAYGLDNGAEGLYAVYDLGGGTFDFSLLRMQMGVFQVLATGGDAQLGGDDIDHALATWLLKECGFAGTTLDNAATGQLHQACRAVKEQLSTQAQANFNLALPIGLLQRTVTLQELETLLLPLVERTLRISRAVLKDAETPAEELQGIVLVGGATRTPLVRRMIAGAFKREPLTNVNPDEVVAVGAALQADALTQGSNNLLLDVTPLSLGIETMGGIVEKIIYRNTPIPVAMAQDFTTYQDNQNGMVIHVLQGEREMVEQCRSLARFDLQGIPALPAGMARIRVTFTVDADGLLTVSALEQGTGVSQTVEVKPTYGLAEGEIEKMLIASMEHAREDMLQRLLTEARVEAERILLALDAALEQDGTLLSEAEHQAIIPHAATLREVMQDSDRAAIQSAMDVLEQATKEFATRRVNKRIGAALAGTNINDVQENLSA